MGVGQDGSEATHSPSKSVTLSVSAREARISVLSLSSYLIFISKNPEEIVQGSRVRAPSQKHMPQPDFWELLVACVSAPDTGRVNEKTTLSLLLQLCRLGSQPTLGTAETTQLWARGTGGHANKETQPLGWCGPTMSATGKLHVPARADNSKAPSRLEFYLHQGSWPSGLPNVEVSLSIQLHHQGGHCA